MGAVNLTGDGINTAQRIMSLAAGGQILVSNGVLTAFRPRKKYWRTFRQPRRVVKHVSINVPQFVGKGYPGLSVSLPRRLKPNAILKAAGLAASETYITPAVTK